MFSLFNNLFGKGRMRKPVEQALTMCILDEIKEEDRIMKARNRILAENERVLAILGAKEKAIDAIISHSNAIREISLQLERAAGVQDELFIDSYISCFCTYLLYDAVSHSDRPRNEQEQALERVLECCPERLPMHARQVFYNIRSDSKDGKLIYSMKDFPLIILDLAHKSKQTDMGNRFLQEMAELLMAAGDLLDLEYPDAGYAQSARQTGQQWMDWLLEQIQG